MLCRLRPFVWSGVRPDVPDRPSFSFTTRRGLVLATGSARETVKVFQPLVHRISVVDVQAVH